MGRRHGAERPHVGDLPFVAAHGRLDQNRRDKIPVNVALGVEALSLQTNLALQTGIITRLCSSRHVAFHNLEKIVGVGPFVARTTASTG